MQELFDNMFVPEYTITTKTLKNIARAEYAKSVVDNTPILQHWENQLRRDANTDTLFALLQQEKINIAYETVKKVEDELVSAPIVPLRNLRIGFTKLHELAKAQDYAELEIKYLGNILLEDILPKSLQTVYRSTPISNKTLPQEVLADMTEFADWLNTLSAKEEHPLIVAAISRFKLLKTYPLDSLNTWFASLIMRLTLESKGYHFKNYLTLEDYFYKTHKEEEWVLNELINEADYTKVIEYFCEQFADNADAIAQKVKLLAKDTKVARAAGRARLTLRQERIVEFLQDYGVLQNKDFARVFPDISEDSVLRDLKTLIEKGIVEKRGSTKSSRYELK